METFNEISLNDYAIGTENKESLCYKAGKKPTQEVISPIKVKIDKLEQKNINVVIQWQK